MYIQTPEGSWLDLPAWRTQFLLSAGAELETLRESGAKALVIDTSARLQPGAGSFSGLRLCRHSANPPLSGEDFDSKPTS